ncbi:alpha/beta hydrolase [Planctomycetota bacterium]
MFTLSYATSHTSQTAMLTFALNFASLLLMARPATTAAADSLPPPKAIPAPRALTISTKDGVNLHTTYYPGTEGKKTAVIVLLHGDKGPMGPGSGTDCAALAAYLQTEKHAVFTPDLRGYGRSTSVNAESSDDGDSGTMDSKRFRRDDIKAMVEYDMEALKKKIVELHNKGDLNANLICVVGFDMGSVVALNWTRLDWNMQSLPNLKQSEDVRAMVLVSPLQSFRGYAIREALANDAVRGEVDAMVIFGTRAPTNAASGRRIFKTLERSHAPIPTDEKERKAKQDLFLRELPTSLMGTRLLSVRELQLPQHIRDFVALRVVQHRDRYPWKSRVIR